MLKPVAHGGFNLSRISSSALFSSPRGKRAAIRERME